jgi:chemotaxis signal transduction protein
MQLFLQIATGTQGLLLDVECIVRVLPMMRISSVPHAAPAVSGIINYQGRAVPVLDLCEIILQRPASRQLSTRLILISVGSLTGTVSSDGRHVALLAEKVSDVIRLAPDEFMTAVSSADAPYLGPVTNAHGVLLRKLEVAELLSGHRLSTLFSGTGHAA